jgi:hypothetical protein
VDLVVGDHFVGIRPEARWGMRLRPVLCAVMRGCSSEAGKIPVLVTRWASCLELGQSDPVCPKLDVQTKRANVPLTSCFCVGLARSELATP